MKIINATDLKECMCNNNVLLIDVRSVEENKAESINGSCLIPLEKICCKNLPTHNGPIVIHCHSGKRSMEACKRLLAENPDLDLSSLDGGIVAWKNAGFAMQKSCNLLSLDRQLNIGIGSLVFLGTFLGSTVSSFFYVIPAFVGLGLISAGITGCCGISKLLAKMPWNN